MLYNLIALSKEFKDGRKSVDVEITGSLLIIKLDNREVKWAIDSLEIERGGAGGGRGREWWRFQGQGQQQ